MLEEESKRINGIREKADKNKREGSQMKTIAVKFTFLTVFL